MELPPLPLDRTRPLAVQLADGLRAAAVGGALRAGDRLPSTRELATILAVSRTVTAAAYDQLLAEGWVEGRVGAGTFVRGIPPHVTGPGPGGGGGGGVSAPSDSGVRIDLRPGVPCTEVLDRAAWRRAWRAAADAEPDLLPSYAGLPEYCAVVAEHLLRHRGLVTSDVLATGGSTGGLAEVARLLAGHGRERGAERAGRVAVEHPGYQRAISAFAAAGLETVPVPVDEHGLRVDLVPDGVTAVYCTPAHQFPLGARLPADRRIALVERARAEGFLVLEDDYDGELRYDVAPLPLLAALGPDVVVHLGTVSKILTPTLGAGWLVAPPAVRTALLTERERTGTRPGAAGQRVLTAFAGAGDLARHLRRLRRELGERRALVVAALAPVLGDRAGAHVLVPLESAARAREVQSRAAEQGIGLDVLERHGSGEGGIVVGYAGPTRAELESALPGVAELCGR
ncbi:PLP-dependent aminotransferase family protein [Pseudonocardia xishanensis]|uniref:PLP-dependent aminotransferase family protein n=1 Tax=Pseudonocardia xishanensis TaxID=630995 RepID=A0ABP8S2E9_9PSEU